MESVGVWTDVVSGPKSVHLHARKFNHRAPFPLDQVRDFLGQEAMRWPWQFGSILIGIAGHATVPRHSMSQRKEFSCGLANVLAAQTSKNGRASDRERMGQSGEIKEET